MKDCIFCNIIAGNIPAEIIYQDEKIISFLDINPVNFGHALVIPKEHFPYMADVPDKMIGPLFLKSKELMPVIKKALGADYVAVSVVGLDVPHFHIHLVPRYFNDGLASFWPTQKYPAGKMQEVAKKIRSLI